MFYGERRRWKQSTACSCCTRYLKKHIQASIFYFLHLSKIFPSAETVRIFFFFFLWVRWLTSICNLQYFANLPDCFDCFSSAALKIHPSEFKCSYTFGLRANWRIMFTSTLEQFGNLLHHSAQRRSDPA